MTRDTAGAAATAVGFSLALSLCSVVLPLYALASGYSASEVGVLTAVSAVSQLVMRLGIGALLHRYPDRLLMVLAALLMASSTAVVALSASIVPFVLCQLAQGAARGAFWTGSQTHVVRGPGSTRSALARISLSSAVGLLVGPLLAGLLIRWDVHVALLAATAAALLAVVPALLLDHLPPFAPVADRQPGRIWTRPGVDTGCWSMFTTGAWSGLLNSYVPVALAAAGQSAVTIGIVVTVANGANLAGGLVAARLRTSSVRYSHGVSTVCCGLAIGLAAATVSMAPVVGVFLALSGLAAGILQVVGPALAVDAVHDDERGDVLAVTGTFRAIALFSSPLTVAGLLSVVALGPAMALVGAGMAVPAILGARGGRP